MIVLDTHVVSVMMQPNTGPIVITWLDTLPPQSVWTTAITVCEIQYGLRILPEGRKRRVLTDRFAEVIRTGLGDRVLDFDSGAAGAAAELAAALRPRWIGIDLRDLMIAGAAAAHNGTLATRNIRRFTETGVPLVNPWEHPIDRA